MIVNGQQYEWQGVALAMWVTMVTHCWHWKNHSSSSDAPVTGLVTLTGECVRQLDRKSEGDLLCQICSSLQPSTTISAQYCVNKLKNSGQLSFLVYANSNHTLQIDIRIYCFIRGEI